MEILRLYPPKKEPFFDRHFAYLQRLQRHKYEDRVKDGYIFDIVLDPTVSTYTIIKAMCVLHIMIMTRTNSADVRTITNTTDYFRRNKRDAWISLGGIILCVTGAEALFDLGHFSMRAIQISLSSMVYPTVILAYFGQASFLREHNDLVLDVFYASVPKKMYWPMVVVAVMAAIIASQALITGTFLIIRQSLSLGCFPRVKIVHISNKYPGQVYIPEINYLLMFACVFVTLGFRTTKKIRKAYGISVVFVMVLTLTLLVLIMVMIWRTHIALIIVYVLTIRSSTMSRMYPPFTRPSYL